MVARRYVGIGLPAVEFEKMRPWREQILEMQSRVRPFGPEYHQLEALKRQLETTADHFTGQRGFFTVGNVGHRA